MNLPVIIQGGMGVAISDWNLAKTVSQLGQLGVVSGTGISRIVSCRLMDGDLAGNVRRALSNFALPEPVQAVIDRYYIPGGRKPGEPYKARWPTASPRPSSWINSPPSPTSSKFFWRGKGMRASSASICWRRFRCRPWPRSTARCWRASITC